jgi:DNA modification methylase
MTVTIRHGDCREILRTLPDQSVHCCVTSPPYFGLRDYGHAGQIGLEATPDAFVAEMVAVFREVKRVLRDDGTLWLNLGDSYNNRTKVRDTNHQPALNDFVDDNWAERAARGGVRMSIVDGDLKEKDLLGIPWMAAFALRADGWYLRDAIVWAKPNGMPGSQTDRCTSSYEMIFQFSKSRLYWSDFDSIKTPPRESSLVRTAQDLQSQAGSHRANGGGKTNGSMKAVGVHSRKSDKQRGHSRKHDGFNDRWDAMERSEQQAKPATMRNVWFVAPAQFDEAHYAVMPDEIARRCILAGCPNGGTVLDPFLGAGTTAMVADRLARDCIGIELNPENVGISDRRVRGDAGMFAEVSAVTSQDQS